MKHSSRILLSAALTSGLLALAPRASAQSSQVPDTNWRQPDRDDATAKKASPQNFALELRFGPYKPGVDSEFEKAGSTATPYAETFGSGQRLYFGLEFDYLPLKIPYVGNFGLGLGWGYTKATGVAKISSGPNAGQDSAETTSLSVMPMYGVAVLRIDALLQYTVIPLVPYGKFGVGVGVWQASKGSGTSTFTNTAGASVSGVGATWGLQAGVGAMLCLNFIDKRAAARLDEATGVNHSYIFAEWMNARLDNFGRSGAMQVGASTFVAGLAIDM